MPAQVKRERKSSRLAVASKNAKQAAKPKAEPAPVKTTKRVKPADDEQNTRPAKRAKTTPKATSTVENQKPKAAATKNASKPRARATTTRAPKPGRNTRTALAAASGKDRTPAPEEAREHKARAKVVETDKFSNALPKASDVTIPGNHCFAWGAGNFGQFGMGPDVTSELNKPRKNPWVDEKMEEGTFGKEGAGFEAIAAGGLHSVFLDGQGTVWTCGTNDDAALGRQTSKVPDPKKEDAFMDEDDLTAYPHPIESLRKGKFRTVRVVAGDSTCAVISDKGDFRAWGTFRGSDGILGFSQVPDKKEFEPTKVLKLPTGEKAVQAASGNNHILVLTTKGHVYAFGASEQGELGIDIDEKKARSIFPPSKTEEEIAEMSEEEQKSYSDPGRKWRVYYCAPQRLDLEKIVVVGAGNYTSFAVNHKGDVYGWGLNSKGQTGTTSSIKSEGTHVQSHPKLISALSKKALGGETVVAISGGEGHTLFLTSGGRVFSCGIGAQGQLGLPEDHKIFSDAKASKSVAAHSAVPIHVPFPNPEDPVVQISAGINSNLAVTKNGAMYTWGDCAQSELAAGDETTLFEPKLIVGTPTGKWTVSAAVIGGQHGLALLKPKST